MARQIAKLKLGYFPLPATEARRIRRFLSFPAGGCPALDPCIGDGAAFLEITSEARTVRYGIELDAYRAEQVRAVVDQVIQGSCFDVHCPVESLSLLYENPPYDFECGEECNLRLEQLFLEHTYRWLKPGGLLILVVPAERLSACSQVLAAHFKDKRIFRLTEPECVRYNQVVLFGVRRTRQERDRLKDAEVARARQLLWDLSRHPERHSVLSDAADAKYQIPEGAPVQLVYRGLPLDEIEDLLPKSAAYRQARRILFAEEAQVTGRPLTPLHSGHVALLATSGLLNGIFGRDGDRHVACWQSQKVTDHFEEEGEDGTITIRDRERFTNSVTLAFRDGRTAILGDENAT
jgi:hypothetical protein